MRTLRPDVFARRSRRPDKRRTPGAAMFILGLAATALLVLSRIEHPLVLKARSTLSEWAAPAVEGLARPLRPLRHLADRLESYSVTAAELDALRHENQRLKVWQARAEELERRLADLGALAKVVAGEDVRFVTARIFADARGPFARSALLDAGSSAGVRIGHPVIDSHGLVGRILETGARTSRILLLTDLNSRIPVLIGPDGARGILIGDNSPRPRLAHVDDGVRLEAGQAVVSSGVGGLMPRGLRIGTVAGEDAGTRVALHARLDRLDHVSVLFYELPGLDLAADLARGGTGSMPRGDKERR